MPFHTAKKKGPVDFILLNNHFYLSPFFKIQTPFFLKNVNSDVPNGSALTQENISLLSNKTSSLNLSEDPEGGGDSNDSQRSGVTSSSAP